MRRPFRVCPRCNFFRKIWGIFQGYPNNLLPNPQSSGSNIAGCPNSTNNRVGRIGESDKKCCKSNSNCNQTCSDYHNPTMPSMQGTAPGAKSSKFTALNPFTPFLAQPVRDSSLVCVCHVRNDDLSLVYVFVVLLTTTRAIWKMGVMQ